MTVNKGSTRFFTYSNDRKVIGFSHEVNYDDVGEVTSQMREVVRRSNGSAPSSSGPEVVGELISAPWIFRKLFGWQNVIKRP
jgi:hypothetical protein